MVSYICNRKVTNMRRDVFQAIADPTRRDIIGLLSSRPLNLNEVAENFDISRPAVSKDIKILTECGLVVIRQEGRERYCEARLQKLREVSRWVEQYERFWTMKLNALKEFVENGSRASVPAPLKKRGSKRK